MTQISAKDKFYIPLIVTLSTVVPLAVALRMLFPSTFKLGQGPDFAKYLPAFNAILNGTTALLLMLGAFFIVSKRVALHRASMISAFALSAIFLVSYVISKISNDPVPFRGEGWVRSLYFFILITHIALSVPVLPLAMLAIYRGLTNEYTLHKKIVKYTFPIWMYVAVTGVLVYLFMAPYYPM